MDKNYSEIADSYAYDVMSGHIPANVYIKHAVKEHIGNKKLVINDDYPYEYDADKAYSACRFIELQYHTKGKWAQKKEHLVLEPWQVFFVCNVFGWVRKRDGLRKYREALLLVPRKNGKSALAAAIGLYMMCADNEYGAEVYTGATSEKQAKEVFTPAQIMARKNPAMLAHYGIMVNASNICIEKNGSKMEPVIGNPPDGSSPSCAIIDEVHEHKDSRLIDTMITGMGAREQPLALYITTAGFNVSGPCYSMQIELQKQLEGAITRNDRQFAMIYGVDQGDDWTDIETLKKANPNFDVSVSADFLEARLVDARANARKQSAFKTKHLNIWCGSRESFFNVEKWRACGRDDLKISDYYGRPAFIGMDLASRVDIAAIEIYIPGEGDDPGVRFGKYYLPEEQLEVGNESYRAWASEGWLTITDGEIIDFGEIKQDVLEICSLFEVHELGYDPHQATMLVTELMAEGVPVVEVRQSVANFSEPMKMLDAMIRSGMLYHNNDPVMTWMISNVTAQVNAKDEVYPRKEVDENKIDGVVALLMALGRSQKERELEVDFDNLLSVTL